MENCIFCKIINKEIPCYKIYEDENTLAFLDISKDFDGHTLVIPKKHVRNMIDCDKETLHHVIDSVSKIINHYKTLGYTGFNVLNNNEIDGEQGVFHLHFHIYPRKSNESVKIFPKLDCANLSLDEVCEKLKLN